MLKKNSIPIGTKTSRTFDPIEIKFSMKKQITVVIVDFRNVNIINHTIRLSLVFFLAAHKNNLFLI